MILKCVCSISGKHIENYSIYVKILNRLINIIIRISYNCQ